MSCHQQGNETPSVSPQMSPSSSSVRQLPNISSRTNESKTSSNSRYHRANSEVRTRSNSDQSSVDSRQQKNGAPSLFIPVVPLSPNRSHPRAIPSPDASRSLNRFRWGPPPSQAGGERAVETLGFSSFDSNLSGIAEFRRRHRAHSINEEGHVKSPPPLAAPANDERPFTSMLPKLDSASADRTAKEALPTASVDRLRPEDLVVVGGLGVGAYAAVVEVKHEPRPPALEGAAEPPPHTPLRSSAPPHFALKCIAKARFEKTSARGRLRRELRILKDIAPSPFLLRCHAAFEAPSAICFVTDLCPGGDLFWQLEHRVELGSLGLAEKEALAVLAEVALGVCHLHARGFLHRDLKVENVMLGADGHVKLVDFGLAFQMPPPSKARVQDDRRRGGGDGSSGGGGGGGGGGSDGEVSSKPLDYCEHHLVTPMSPVGSLVYMSPERLQLQVGGRFTDWWALGVLAFEVLTGCSPWSSLDDTELVKKEIRAFQPHPNLPGANPLAGQFVCALLEPNFEARLGTRSDHDVLRHRYFAAEGAVDWAALEAGRAPPLNLPAPGKRVLASSLARAPAATGGGGSLSPTGRGTAGGRRARSHSAAAAAESAGAGGGGSEEVGGAASAAASDANESVYLKSKSHAALTAYSKISHDDAGSGPPWETGLPQVSELPVAAPGLLRGRKQTR